jgi:hypothetical protein
LFASDKVHQFARYSPLYQGTQKSSKDWEVLKRLSCVNKPVIVGLEAHFGHWMLEGNAAKKIRQAVVDIQDNSILGLTVLLEIIKTIKK